MSTPESIRHDARMQSTYAKEALQSAQQAYDRAIVSASELIMIANQTLSAEQARIVRDYIADMFGDTWSANLQSANENAKDTE